MGICLRVTTVRLRSSNFFSSITGIFLGSHMLHGMFDGELDQFREFLVVQF